MLKEGLRLERERASRAWKQQRQGCPGSPRGQVRVRWEVSEGEPWCPPSPRRGAQGSALRAKAKSEQASRAGSLQPHPTPSHSSGPQVKATLGKIY